MTLFLHEMRRARLSLLIWTAVISFMLALTVFIYPQMAQQMDEMSKAFSEMGDFSKAFGMDSLNFGELTDYFCVECGNVLGLGGAIFAAIAGASLAKEEREHTAEYLLSHPVSRLNVAGSKLCAVWCQIVILNGAVAAVTSLSILAIGEKADAGIIALSFVAYLILQLEIAAIAFALSSFAVRGGLAAGIGIVFGLYFLNILANITEDAAFLKNLTPFALADGAGIRESGGLEGKYIAVSAFVVIAAVTLAFLRYRKKDL